jgi:hypothetical protein
MQSTEYSTYSCTENPVRTVQSRDSDSATATAAVVIVLRYRILSPLSLLDLVGLSRGKVDTLFYLDRFLLRSVWEIAAEPSEYRAPHQDFGSCREIGAKTHWGSIRSHFCVRPAPRPADAKVTVAECTCTVSLILTSRPY